MASEFLDVAVDAADSAGKLLEKGFRHKVNVRHKSACELVSDLDVAAEEAIVSRIKKAFPDHCIESEEMGCVLGRDEYKWVIDPLDGTHNFLYGLPLYGVSIALLRGEEPVLGVISLPAFRETYVAVKGGGATVNGASIHASSRALSESILFFESHIGGRQDRRLDLIGALSRKAFSVRILGVASLSFACVARGFSDFYEIRDFKLWDVAAGALLVSEAGGRVSDFYGMPWNIHSKNIAVSNGVIHDEIVGFLK